MDDTTTLNDGASRVAQTPESLGETDLLALYQTTRQATERLAAGLSPEDQQLQSMPDASPTKWHRAHTTWFFETFVLAPEGMGAVDDRYAFLFNSYYDAIGERHARAKRGLISRPTAAEVTEYRRGVDARMEALLGDARGPTLGRISAVLLLGIAHEEQHQELLLTDILHAFSENPLSPAYQVDGGPNSGSRSSSSEPRFVRFDGGLHTIGAPHDGPFVFDNERPRHKEWVEPFDLADRLVTVRELKAFIREGGYQAPSLWLSEGFDFVQQKGVRAPLYSKLSDGELRVFTLSGWRTAEDDEPAVHVSYYEADAIARFLGARLPTEAEWEVAAMRSRVQGNFADDGVFRALPAPRRFTEREPGGAEGLHQLFGDAWEWTRSSYEAYPGYSAPSGALGEYNGKFMVNQRVLRGGSCLTPRRHVRSTYRNFWPPGTRFQMTGVRLARGAS